LSLLVRAHPEIFEVKRQRGQGTAHIFVRLKRDAENASA
jgi:hypothetical protein